MAFVLSPPVIEVGMEAHASCSYRSFISFIILSQRFSANSFAMGARDDGFLLLEAIKLSG
jgi:hypothetical protein